MKAYRNILLLAVTALIFASCSTTLKQRKTVDDLYYNPSEERANYSFEEDFSSEYNSILENDSLKDVDSTIYANKEKSYNSEYDKLLVDDYDEAYQRRLSARNDPWYGMNNYYNIYFSDAWWRASAFDPMFYNVIVMGRDVWVEPHYLSSHFGYGWRYSPYYSPFYNNYRYGGSYYGFGFGYYSYIHSYSPYSGLYYGGYYSYNPYHYGSADPKMRKRKLDEDLRSKNLDTRSESYATTGTPLTRVQSDNDLKKQAEDKATRSIRTRDGENRVLTRDLGERERRTNQYREENKYIRRADNKEQERRVSTYNKVERDRTQKYNTSTHENTLRRYIEQADRERSSVVNHRYYDREANKSNSRAVRSILQNSDNSNDNRAIRKRSTYQRQRSTNSNRNANINNSSNNNRSSSTIRTRSSSSSNNSSTRSSSGSSSSSSSSSGRKRK